MEYRNSVINLSNAVTNRSCRISLPSTLGAAAGLREGLPRIPWRCPIRRAALCANGCEEWTRPPPLCSFCKFQLHGQLKSFPARPNHPHPGDTPRAPAPSACTAPRRPLASRTTASTARQRHAAAPPCSLCARACARD